MLSEENMCANKFENMQAIRGETVKGVLEIEDQGRFHYLIVFESGYSLELNSSNCAFWINNQKRTNEIIKAEVQRRAAFIENLDEVKKLL